MEKVHRAEDYFRKLFMTNCIFIIFAKLERFHDT